MKDHRWLLINRPRFIINGSRDEMTVLLLLSSFCFYDKRDVDHNCCVRQRKREIGEEAATFSSPSVVVVLSKLHTDEERLNVEVDVVIG